MSTSQEFNVTVNGKDYNLTTSTQGSRGHFVVTVHNGAIRGPQSAVHLAGYVEYVVQAHIAFCLEQIADGLGNA